jgi:hypothetical protein
MEREAGHNRLTQIRVTGSGEDRLYHATIAFADGTKRALLIREDGQLATSP